MMEILTRKYCCDSVIQIENFKCVMQFKRKKDYSHKGIFK